MEDIIVRPGIIIPSDALSVSFSRSGGKGGQNVNKVSTKVELTLDLTMLRASAKVRSRILSKLASRVDAELRLRVVVQDSRSQWQNRQTAVERIVELVHAAAEVEKERIATRPTRSSRQQRVEGKKKEGMKKQARSTRFRPGDDE